MRIALFPDEFLPESPRVHARMIHELAQELIRLGNEVIVITPGQTGQRVLLSICYYEGVEVWKFKSGALRGTNKLMRAVNESLLSFRAWRAIKPELSKKPIDMCINYSPTIFFGPLIKKIKKNNGAYIYLILRDLFPKWVIDEGIIKKHSLVASYFRYFESLNYEASDVIGLMSQSNLDYFRSVYPQYKNLDVLPNWRDSTIKHYELNKIDIREKFKLKDKVIFFYGGNIGHAQDILNLVNLVKSMKEEKRAHFFFVGQGDKTKLLLDAKKQYGLDNLTYMPSVSSIEHDQILSQVDVGLVSIAKSHKVNHYPGKVLGYMKYSLPVLGSLNSGNDLIDILNKREIGFIHENGDDDQLLNSAFKLLNDKKLRHIYGINSRNCLISLFSLKKVARKILNHVENQ